MAACTDCALTTSPPQPFWIHFALDTNANAFLHKETLPFSWMQMFYSSHILALFTNIRTHSYST
uniref:Uncharacterized protein n=1 Tax=Anguilla anguilla TaxID=7936 RepID=A0A0E9R0S3_ANGAN